MIDSLTPLELDLLRTLTRRVCILTLSQIASGWWPALRRLRGVRQQLRRLEMASLVEVDCINAHPLMVVDRLLNADHPLINEPERVRAPNEAAHLRLRDPQRAFRHQLGRYDTAGQRASPTPQHPVSRAPRRRSELVTAM